MHFADVAFRLLSSRKKSAVHGSKDDSMVKRRVNEFASAAQQGKPKVG